MRHVSTVLAIATLLAAGALYRAPVGHTAEPTGMKPVDAVGDTIPRPLTDIPGDAGRGRDVSFSRERANCIVCHAITPGEEAMQGNLGPDLTGVANRMSAGQMRLRLVDGSRINPASIMPSYYRVEGLKRVAAAYAGKSVLTAQEIEDVIAFLQTLRSEKAR